VRERQRDRVRQRETEGDRGREGGEGTAVSQDVETSLAKHGRLCAGKPSDSILASIYPEFDAVPGHLSREPNF